MNVIKITESRMNDILPINIKRSDVISEKAKKILACIMNYHYVLDVCKQSGYLAIPNEALLASVGGRKEALLPALQELIDYDLIIRERGCKREAGKKPIASKYYVRWENLKKELKKKSSDDLISFFLNTSKKGDGPVDVDTVVDTVSDIDSVSDIVFDNVIEDEFENESVTATEHDNKIKRYIDNNKRRIKNCFSIKECDELEEELGYWIKVNSKEDFDEFLRELENLIGERRCEILCNNYS